MVLIMTIQNHKLSNLPVPLLNNVMSFLPQNDRGSAASVSQRFEHVVNHPTFSELENMRKRRAKSISPKTQQPTKIMGPTRKFLMADPTSGSEKYQVSTIKVKMDGDRNVAKLVLTICSIEDESPQYIPFYHAMNLNTYLFSMFTRILLSIPYQDNEFPCSNPLIRFPESHGPKTVDELFAQHPVPKDKNAHYDHSPDVQRELLSLNPDLFANLMTDGESTWQFYLNDQSVHAPNTENFFRALCKKYHVPMGSKYFDLLLKLHAELCDTAAKYSRLNCSAESREMGAGGKGVVLQILVPQELVDDVAYASLPYGMPDTSSSKPLSQRCLALRNNPRTEMQARLLCQSLFVPDHKTKVLTHGYGEFFEREPRRFSQVSDADWGKQQKLIVERNKIRCKIKAVFKMMLAPPSKK
jgi:hypothetical protein